MVGADGDEVPRGNRSALHLAGEVCLRDLLDDRLWSGHDVLSAASREVRSRTLSRCSRFQTAALIARRRSTDRTAAERASNLSSISAWVRGLFGCPLG